MSALDAFGDFPQLSAARARTGVGLRHFGARLAGVDARCVALMGSWGRMEVTHGSDTTGC